MSLSFSDTTNYDGLVQFIERTLGFPRAYISGDADRLKDWTADLNLALDSVVALAIRSSGKWNFDDSNHTTYPILTGNLVDGQRDYSFTADSDGNLVLDIHKVLVRMSSTEPYYQIFPKDAQSGLEGDVSSFLDGQNLEGRPQYYDLTATGILLDPIPNANVTAGLKVLVNREGSYFTTSDTTKKPGFYGLYHEYLVLEACYRYARAHRLDCKEDLKRDLKEMQEEVEDAYARRSMDEVVIIGSELVDYE